MKEENLATLEGDTVYSCKNKSKAGLFTLTERKTRAEIVVKIPNRKAQTIVAALDQIEKSLGSKKLGLCLNRLLSISPNFLFYRRKT